jgi:hypothetical protein
VIALTISFIVAGLFWFSHHRRLAVAPEGSRGVVCLNLVFLLSIIILPVTNGLYGGYRGRRDLRRPSHHDRHAERAVVDPCAARPQRSDIDGDGVVSDSDIRHRDRHRLVRSGSGAVHTVPWVLRALRGLARRTTRTLAKGFAPAAPITPRLIRNHSLHRCLKRLAIEAGAKLAEQIALQMGRVCVSYLCFLCLVSVFIVPCSLIFLEPELSAIPI